MKTEISKVIDKYYDFYYKIFDSIYPAHNSTGFTERNQTVNFSKAIESLYDDVISWFEYPVGDNKHIDAIIINKGLKEVFIIEAKRFSIPKKKIKSMGEDIIRITDSNIINMIKKNLPQANDYTYYGVILSDVWTENRPKTNIFETWGESFLDKYRDLIQLPANINLNDLKWFKKSFENKDIRDESIKKNYKLLIMISELKQI